jgi:phosphoglycolate phosphatase
MLLIFDLDGTLVDSKVGILNSLSTAIFTVTGEKQNLDTIKIGPPIKQIACDAMPLASVEIISQVAKEYRAQYDSIGWASYSLYKDVKETLTILAKKHTLVVATNKPKIPTKKIMDDSGLSIYFENIYCHGSPGFTDKISVVSSLVEQNEGMSVMIGDSQDDFLAASNNKIPFIFCSYGYGIIHDKNKCMPISEFSSIVNRIEVMY